MMDKSILEITEFGDWLNKYQHDINKMTIKEMLILYYNNNEESKKYNMSLCMDKWDEKVMEGNTRQELKEVKKMSKEDFLNNKGNNICDLEYKEDENVVLSEEETLKLIIPTLFYGWLQSVLISQGLSPFFYQNMSMEIFTGIDDAIAQQYMITLLFHLRHYKSDKYNVILKFYKSILPHVFINYITDDYSFFFSQILKDLDIVICQGDIELEYWMYEHESYILLG